MRFPAKRMEVSLLLPRNRRFDRLNRDELLWSSTSRTINPKNIDDLVNEVAYATAKEMVKQGLLARQ
jgi:hypothetical protein